MIRKSSHCNIPMKDYLEKIINGNLKKVALKKINRAFSLKKELSIVPDVSDHTLSKALELYASSIMSEKFIIEANDFLMEHSTHRIYVKPWAKELHEYWQLIQQQIELAEKLIRAIVQEREKEHE